MIKKTWITPSWLNLLLNLGCSVIAMGLAILLRLNFSLEDFKHYPIRDILTVVLSTNLLLSFLFHTPEMQVTDRIPFTCKR